MSHLIKIRDVISLILLFVLFSPTSVFAADIPPSLLEALAAAAPGEEIHVIVTFSAQPDLRPFKAQVKTQRRAGVVRALRGNAEESQKEVRALLHGRGKKFDPLWIVNGLAVAATPELIASLAARPEVARIELDAVIKVPEVVPSQIPGVEWNIEAVGAPALWAQGFTGQGVTIAVLDSGVAVNHPDLLLRWRGGANSWFDPYLNTPTPYDLDGHGTLVTGVIVGGNAGGTAIGVAPGSQWIAAKIFDDAGEALNSRIVLSMQWALDPNGDGIGDDAPDLVNASWGFDLANTCVDGSPEFGAPPGTVRQAVQALKAAGIGVIAAAGNAGTTTEAPSSISPGNYPETVAVGAVDRSSRVGIFSGRGPAPTACGGAIFPNLVAPGVAIRTSDLPPDLFAVVDGTSFSAPHVSGVMALLLSAFPTLTPDDLEATLETSATDLGTFGADNSYGFGLVNAVAAFNLLSGVPDLAVHDPAPPEGDLILNFGHVPPGTAADRTITVRNAGNGILNITAIGTVAAPFAVLANGCAGASLTAGQSCTVSLRFAPPTLGIIAEQELQVQSSDPDQPTVNLQLRGTGNTLPPAAQLVAPANGATGVGETAILQWTQLPDADGDPLTHFVFLSTREDFSDTVPQQASSGDPRSALLAGAGGLLSLGLAVRFGRRRQWLASTLALAATLALLAACNGGGSSDDGPPPGLPPGTPMSFSATGLAPGTTYFWKVVSQDSHGGAVQGEVRHFTTSSN